MVTITKEEHDSVAHTAELLRRLSLTGEFSLGMSFDMSRVAQFLEVEISPLYRKERE